MVSILKITKGNNFAKKCRCGDHSQSLHVVWSCFIFFLPSFSEIISNGIKVIERTRFLY